MAWQVFVAAACAVVGPLCAPAVPAVAAASGVVMVDLGTLPGGATSHAIGIDDAGNVVGISGVAGGTEHAFIWRNGRMTDLGTLGGTASAPAMIGLHGEVVGTSTTATGAKRGFLWRAGVMTDLGTLDDASVHPYSIGPDGTIVGALVSSEHRQSVFRWRDGAMRYLPTLPGDTTALAVRVNRYGQAVGYSQHIPSGRVRAVTWLPDGSVHALDGTDTTEYSVATWIDDSGQIAGSLGIDVAGSAVLWSADGHIARIGPRSSQTVSVGARGDMVVSVLESQYSRYLHWTAGGVTGLCGAVGVGGAPNSRGFIAGAGNVGTLAGLGGSAFVWHANRFVDLGRLSGDSYATGVAINAGNQVAGWSGDGNQGRPRRAVLWRLPSGELPGRCMPST